LSKHLGFNDNKIVSYKVSKRQVNESEKEYVLVEIEELEGWWNNLKVGLIEFKEFIRRYVNNEKP